MLPRQRLNQKYCRNDFSRDARPFPKQLSRCGVGREDERLPPPCAGDQRSRLRVTGVGPARLWSAQVSCENRDFPPVHYVPLCLGLL